jgi:hypothetical protein
MGRRRGRMTSGKAPSQPACPRTPHVASALMIARRARLSNCVERGGWGGDEGFPDLLGEEDEGVDSVGLGGRGFVGPDPHLPFRLAFEGRILDLEDRFHEMSEEKTG